MSFLVWECLYFYSLRPIQCVTCHLTWNDCKVQQNKVFRELKTRKWVLRLRLKITVYWQTPPLILHNLGRTHSACFSLLVVQSRWGKSLLESRKCPHRPGESSASHVLCWETSGNCQRGDCLYFHLFPQRESGVDNRSNTALYWFYVGLQALSFSSWMQHLLNTRTYIYLKTHFFKKDKRRLCCCSHRPETKVERWQPGWTCQICGWLWA